LPIASHVNFIPAPNVLKTIKRVQTRNIMTFQKAHRIESIIIRKVFMTIIIVGLKDFKT
jgi:hypothetical protein